MNNFELEGIDLADQVISSIEKNYGRTIARIPFFERTGQYTFDLKVIFADFRLLEATIMIVPHYVEGFSTIRVEGEYF
jgi:hypothetical protein